MISLSAKKLHVFGGDPLPRPFVARVSEDAQSPWRGGELYLTRTADTPVPDGFRGYLFAHGVEARSSRLGVALPESLSYLQSGDVVRLDPRRRHVAVLYRRSSASNSLLVTERCDNRCLMCSQPPKERLDDWLLDDLLSAIPWISSDTTALGITGGEPALLGDRLLTLIDAMGRYLPRTMVHMLSNGRAFANADFAQKLAEVRHPDLLVAVPLYSDLPEEHDYVVQARGAFDETVRGILRLKQFRVRVEIRFVIHRETRRRLPDFARFITRNLLFADHVALMGLELMGYARTNLEQLWIDPLDYQHELLEATLHLDSAGVPVSIYNHQLCTLDRRLHPFSRRSISDWKNEYWESCLSCSLRETCGGFFSSSALRRSRGIRPIPNVEVQDV
ncbi:MAG: His-Xaa-Ser system radical SAM maturase HxsC [Polyangiaceae bacterium]